MSKLINKIFNFFIFFHQKKYSFPIDGNIFQIKSKEILKVDVDTRKEDSLTVYIDWIEIK